MKAALGLRRWAFGFAWLGLGVALAPPAAAARSVVSEPTSRTELHVTAYRAGYQETAFLREIREVDIPAGEVRIALQGVPDTVQRESVSIRIVEGPPVDVLEQTYAYDILTPAAVMKASEGTNIVVDTVGAHDGKLHPITAAVVAANSEGTVLRTRDGYTFGLDAERLRMSRVPERLAPRPTLLWHANASRAGRRKVEISYLLTGLRWNADYVATLSRNGRQLDLSGWVTFENRTAAEFADTRLAVAAGTIHRVDVRRVTTLSEVTISGEEWDRTREPIREALGHLHLYKIPEKTTLAPHSIKNVRLLSLDDVPVERKWVTGFHVQPERHEFTRTQRPNLSLEMMNDEKSNAGIPIPAGTVRVMMPDGKGTPHLVASSSVVDTPKGERLKIDMGPVADVTVRLVPKDYRTSLLGSKEGTYALEIRNGSPNAGVVRVELQPGVDTELDLQGIEAQRPSAATYRIEVPMGPGAMKTFRVVAKVTPRR